MKSIKNIKRIYKNEIYISISIKEAIEAQKLRYKLITISEIAKAYLLKRLNI